MTEQATITVTLEQTIALPNIPKTITINGARIGIQSLSDAILSQIAAEWGKALLAKAEALRAAAAESEA